MDYVETAIDQLQLGLKLWHAAEEGKLNADDIDVPVTIDWDGTMSAPFVLKNRIFSKPEDFMNSIRNQISMAFGVAAIALNRRREENGVLLPDPINTVEEQWCGLVYQIRNAFAHDIAEPKWNITKPRFARKYEISAHIKADLSNVNDKSFEWSHVGGPGVLVLLKHFGKDHGII